MEPMKPMKPMEPMKPLDFGEAWWPEELGKPASVGSQDGMRYAFFPDKKRLLVERNGERTTYDSGNHRINGVQQQGGGGAAAFASDDGPVALDSLAVVR